MHLTTTLREVIFALFAICFLQANISHANRLHKFLHRQLSDSARVGFPTSASLKKWMKDHPKVDVNKADRRHGTAFQMVVEASRADLIITLHDSGVNIDAKNRNGDTALCRAIVSPDRDLSIIQLLIKFGVNLDVTCNEETPLELAVRLELGKVVEMIKNGPKNRPGQDKLGNGKDEGLIKKEENNEPNGMKERWYNDDESMSFGEESSGEVEVKRTNEPARIFFSNLSDDFLIDNDHEITAEFEKRSEDNSETDANESSFSKNCRRVIGFVLRPCLRLFMACGCGSTASDKT